MIQISCVVQLQGSDEPLCQVIFTLNGCAPISGAGRPLEDRGRTPAKMVHFIRRVDRTSSRGYNTQNFDMPRLLKRAAALAKSGKTGDVLRAGAHCRFSRECGNLHPERADGENVDTTVDGRVVRYYPFVAASCLLTMSPRSPRRRPSESTFDATKRR